MSCGVRSKRKNRAAPSAPGALARGLGAADGDHPREHEISGTWDFKWPLGSELRVAFQKPPGTMQVSADAFRQAVHHVIGYAKRWQLPRGLQLTFLDDPAQFLEPPLGEKHSLTDQHRSAFDPATARRVRYDILVSMQDLPLRRVDPFRALGQEIDDVLFPVSELGSYARRTDYGAPTMYIGRFGRMLEHDFLSYYAHHPLAQHVTVHEFGHALGIPHMHQHPDLILPQENGEEIPSERAKYRQLDQARAEFYRPAPEVQEVISRALGIQVTPETVSDHLVEVFRGNKAFSDWVQLTPEDRAAHQQEASLPSVMTLPLYAACTKVGRERDLAQLLDKDIITTPQHLDMDMLQGMYLRPPVCSAAPAADVPPYEQPNTAQAGRKRS